MTTFSESETRLRRFLRDPSGDIWTSLDLQTYFNDAQVEVAQKSNILVRVEAHYYPPRYDWAYLFDWEEGYIDGDIYQALQVSQANGLVITYPWEPAWYLSVDSTPDDGDRYTHSWEAHYCSPADPPGILLHANLDKMKYIAYDRLKLDPKDESELQDSDRWYRTRVGLVTNYWRPDDYSNLIYLYPQPSSTTIQEPEIGEILDDVAGLVTSAEEWLDEADVGLVTDYVDLDDSLFCVYSAQPNDVEAVTDTTAFPDFLVKYVEQATLERAYGADSDGFIPSLRDYWKMRKEVSLKALARFQRMMIGDRDFRLGGQPKATSSRRLRLPEHYPAI